MSINESTWRSRIVEHGEASPDELMDNPANWRVHPKRQQKILEALLDDVGWVRHVIVNQTTGHLIDGHLRVRLAQNRGEKALPVVFVELTEPEERVILASLDPIASLAATDQAALMALSTSLVPDSEVSDLVRELAGIQDGYHSSPTQTQIDRRQEEIDHRYDGAMQRTFECTCPECGNDFAFGR